MDEVDIMGYEVMMAIWRLASYVSMNSMFTHGVESGARCGCRVAADDGPGLSPELR
jgi:hypothetical protein